MRFAPHNLAALLVDFDGTLVDSVQPLWSCYQIFMERHQQLALREDFNALIGPSLPEIVIFLKKKFALQQDFGELYAEYRKLIVNAYANEVVLFSDALDVLQRLRVQDVKLGLVTSASLDLIKPFISQSHLVDLFDIVITHIDGEDSKPSPMIYKRALHCLKINPEAVIAIEDSKNGVLSAYAADLYVVQFAGNSEKAKNEAILEGASYKTHSWLEIEKLCERVLGKEEVKIKRKKYPEKQ